jgi:hypothetical protein
MELSQAGVGQQGQEVRARFRSRSPVVGFGFSLGEWLEELIGTDHNADTASRARTVAGEPG